MTNELVALIAQREIGRVRRDARGRLTFGYDDGWRFAPEAYPLSLSMPLAAADHRPTAVESFLWGLLPDNELVLERWARKFQVSARNVFALIARVGEDCAGAVQFVSPERLDEMRRSANEMIAWLDERDIAARLKALREDHAAWRLPHDTGQFSLAGAQPKTAFLFQKGKWGIPSGRIPTTHILKPPTGHFDGHAENEHICLALARGLGLPAAQSKVIRFANEIAIVIERYDRQRRRGEILRVHQEDICQALGIPPSRKYQNEQGPGVADVVSLLRANSDDPQTDVQTFIQALGFSWLIAGTDAHAKNYSLLIGEGQRVRLAPLYDLASILPYDELNLHKAKLAMKIGGEYRLRQIGLRQWEKFAREVRIEPDWLIVTFQAMAQRLPDLISDVRSQSRKVGLTAPLIDRLCDRVARRAEQCGRALTNTGPG